MEIQEAGNQIETYVYNHAGRRIQIKDSAANIREFIYDDRSLLEEYTDDAFTRRHLYADRLIGLETSTDTYHIHLDPLGSTLEITDATGASASSRVYEPWGGIDADKSTGDATLISVLYTGHQLDEATGYYYFGARYYDPALARFLRPDPYFGELTAPPSLHRYLYAYANPYRWVDLWGYSVFEGRDLQSFLFYYNQYYQKRDSLSEY